MTELDVEQLNTILGKNLAVLGVDDTSFLIDLVLRLDAENQNLWQTVQESRERAELDFSETPATFESGSGKHRSPTSLE